MTANLKTPAPTGRRKPAQGKKRSDTALGPSPENAPSPEGAKETTWPVVPLGEIAAVKLGKMLDKAKHRTGRRLPYLRNVNVRWGSIETDDLLEMHFEHDQLDRFGLKAGDVLVCEGGEPGRAAVWDGSLPELKYQKALHRVRFIKPYEARLLVYFLEFLAKTGGLERRFTGSTIKHFTREAFIQLPIPIPPEDEQRRIVAEIDKQSTRLEAGVAALRRLQANLKRYRAAVLKAACEGHLVPTDAELSGTGTRASKFETGQKFLARILAERRQNWEGRGNYQEPTPPSTVGLPVLPDGWTYASVEAVGFVQLGRQCAPKHHNGANMRPYLRVANVFEDRIDIGDVKEMNFTPAEFEVFRLEPNDILLNEGQSLELVGRAAIYRGELPGACFTNTLVRFRPCPSLNVRFALIVFRAFMHAGHFQKIARWTTNIAHLGADRFAKLAFPLPPLSEQSRIVAEVERRLSVVAELEAVVSIDLQHATRLRQSILQKAFSGKLL